MSARSHDSGHSHWFRFRAVGFGLAIAAASAFIVAQPVRAASAQFCFGFGGGPHPVPGGGLSFLPDGIHGWAVSPRLSTPEVGPGCQVGPGVMATSDGGQTWRVERVPLSVRALTGITFVDQLDGWAVGSQAIVATSNGGASWTVQDTPQQTELYNVAFASALTGWAVGSDIAGNPAGVILSTSNGGASWIRQSLPSGIDSLFSVAAVNANDAWAVGQMACSSPGPGYPCPGAIVATTNGGQSWTLQALPAGVVTLQGVTFVNGTTGWAVGIGGGVDCLSTGTCSEAVIATTDGGASWHSQAVPGSGLGGLTDVDFISSTQGWAIGGRLLSTVDGGATWREGTLPNGASVRGIRFTSLKTGWLFGGASFFPAPANIFKTIDAGATWQMEQIPLERTSVRDVALAGSLNGIAAGQTCFALGVGTGPCVPSPIWSDSGGQTWGPGAVPSLPTDTNLFGMSFPSPAAGWAVGGSCDAAGDNCTPVILQTSNGGSSWTTQSPPGGIDLLLQDVSFPNSTTGWAAGRSCVTLPCAGGVLATTDGGTTWTSQNTPSNVADLAGVDFINSTTGWAVGSDTSNAPLIIATLDGGITWTEQTVPASVSALEDVSFVDALDGWAVGQQGTPGASTAPEVLVTHDGGATWTEQSTGVAAGADESLYGADFVSATTGWVVGTGPTGSIILGTIDGGATWVPETLPDGIGQVPFGALEAVAFSDTRNGVAVGAVSDTGVILRTSDGGATWLQSSFGRSNRPPSVASAPGLNRALPPPPPPRTRLSTGSPSIAPRAKPDGLVLPGTAAVRTAWPGPAPSLSATVTDLTSQLEVIDGALRDLF